MPVVPRVGLRVKGYHFRVPIVVLAQPVQAGMLRRHYGTASDISSRHSHMANSVFDTDEKFVEILP